MNLQEYNQRHIYLCWGNNHRKYAQPENLIGQEYSNSLGFFVDFKNLLAWARFLDPKNFPNQKQPEHKTWIFKKKQRHYVDDALGFKVQQYLASLKSKENTLETYSTSS